MTDRMAPPDTDESVVIISVPEFRKHMQRVEFISGTMVAVLKALSQTPMFAGFIPPDVRKQIDALESE